MSEFLSETFGETTECVGCLWERICTPTKADLDELAHSYRRHRGEHPASKLRRIRLRLVGDLKGVGRRLLALGDAGHIDFAGPPRKRGGSVG